MSRTTRRKGWTYWESNKHEAVNNNPLFGNRGWINQSMPEGYQYAINGVRQGFKSVRTFIHRDLKKGWRDEAHKGYLEYNKFCIRGKQRKALHDVMLGDDYTLDEKSIIKADRGISEIME